MLRDIVRDWYSMIMAYSTSKSNKNTQEIGDAINLRAEALIRSTRVSTIFRAEALIRSTSINIRYSTSVLQAVSSKDAIHFWYSTILQAKVLVGSTQYSPTILRGKQALGGSTRYSSNWRRDCYQKLYKLSETRLLSDTLQIIGDAIVIRYSTNRRRLNWYSILFPVCSSDHSNRILHCPQRVMAIFCLNWKESLHHWSSGSCTLFPESSFHEVLTGVSSPDSLRSPFSPFLIYSCIQCPTLKSCSTTPGHALLIEATINSFPGMGQLLWPTFLSSPGRWIP